MKERGMIFNGEMVRAILDGRKTQTRRIMAPQPADDIERCIFPNPEAIGWKSSLRHKHGSTTAHFCHYGKPGDRIWVRETFQGPLFDYDLMDSYCKDPTPFEKPEFCVYKADGVPAPEFYDADDELHCCWRPSIHMPRWASRILLEITNVRVERLNAISEEDATAEGVPPAGSLLPDYPGTFLTPKGDFATAKVAFQRLWESIYGEESWKATPWIWVIEFKRVEGGAV
ncbi:MULTISPECIES: morphogenetic protein [Klebsiella]|uniref:morphogenetic protein n=1 Tax=Klebsiella pneumoniae complex TaxID=3390273 RepID=UPI000B959097|nr:MULTISPECIES: morphogenetic protein [Klebsiella]HBR0902012.1 morphogenetic protein [Klebsiella pneumoniae]MCS6701342.1 morphogenetic protein [Klebsiella pneumoniae subsp. pneumoniae]QDJ78480.1 morphogenetic protein [Klebsiella pneumoniae subsp. pneumoniae]TNJ94006.1 morphogenetic protein [Klebsiella quasipneumoniae subsp. similipneumoniae]HBR0907225.1 morphogenetic protein [Klebsiella pneumoniae]